MTSLLEVQHHPPFAHNHLPSHPHRSYKPAVTNATGSKSASGTASSMDTPMTDAAPRHSTSSQPAAPTTSRAPSTSGTTPPTFSTTQDGSMEVPPSPHIGGLHSVPQTRVVPSSTSTSSPASPQLHTPPQASVASTASPKVKVRSLSHIQSFVLDETNPLSQAGSRLARRSASDLAPQYEISEMPVTDIIEMVAGLLTKITTTNDKQHQHLHRQIPPPEGTAGMSQQTTSVLAFHGKNVPSISILSYLSRIHKYCPTTYEVFLSLLVYFDRMTERVNAGPMNDLRQHSMSTMDNDTKPYDGSRHSSVSTAGLAQDSPQNSQREPQRTASSTTTPPPSGSLGKKPEPAPTAQHNSPPSPPMVGSPTLADEPYNFSHFFVVDSFNIHRLVIAGVTCASKFFSDIFYTNSRYAKVGGLPLPELNHLELQFLLLNDFRLSVPLEEMEAYGTMLVEFYAREVLANHAGVTVSPNMVVAATE